jgi:hypothetical protein
MFINNNDEIALTEVIEKLKDLNTNSNNIDSIKDYIRESIENDKENVLGVISSILASDDGDEFSQSMFDNFIREVVQYKESKGKKIILFALPMIFVECQNFNSISYYKPKPFDNRLKGVHKKIEKVLKNSVKEPISIKVHDTLLDYMAFHGSYKRIANLLDELGDKKNSIEKNSILKSNMDYTLTGTQVCDNLKFVIGIIELDLQQQVYETFEQLENASQDLLKIGYDVENLLLQQSLKTEQIVMLNPMVLTTALDRSLKEYNYVTNENIASKIFLIEPNPEKIGSKIIIETKTGLIRLDFFRKNEDDLIVYSFDIDYPIESYDFEINELISILKELKIGYTIGKE